MKTINDYAELVKAKHALNKSIAPVEDGANIAGSYTSGQQFIRGGVLYAALTTIAANTAWSSLTLDTDYELADDITSQLASLNGALTNAFVNNVKVNGCKNSITIDPSAGGSINAISWSVTEDGTTASAGTASGNSICMLGSAKLPSGTYVLSGCPSGGDANSYYLNISGQSGDTSLWLADFGDGAEFTLTQESEIGIRARVVNGYTLTSDLTFYPMICLKSDYDIDTTYAPPSKTNRQLTEDSVTWDNLSEVGAVNYAPNKLTSASGTDYSYSVDSDGVITVVVTNTLSAAERVTINSALSLKKGTYKLSGCADNGSVDTYRLQIYTSGNTPVALDYGKNGTPYTGDVGDTFTLSSDTTGLTLALRLGSGLTAGTYKFYPMVTEPSYNGPYVPYAKTNKELTDDVTPIANTATRGTDIGSGGANVVYKVGKLVIFSLSLHTEAAIAKNSVLATLPYTPAEGFQVVAMNVSDSSVFNININTTGNIYNTNHALANDKYFIVSGVYVSAS